MAPSGGEVKYLSDRPHIINSDSSAVAISLIDINLHCPDMFCVSKIVQ